MPRLAPTSTLTPATFQRASTAALAGGGTAAVDVPRFEAGRDGLAIIVEEATTNLLTNSTDATVGYNNCVPTANTHIAPDGSLSACTLADALDTGAAAWFRYVTVSPSSSYYTASIYIRKQPAAGKFPMVTLRFLSGGTDQISHFRIDPENGAFLAFGTVTASCAVKDAGDYWRVCLTGKDNDATPLNTQVRFYVYPCYGSSLGGSVVNSLVGSVVLWGPQIELRDRPTSYTPSGIDRAIDKLTIPAGTFPVKGSGSVSFWVKLNDKVISSTRYLFATTNWIAGSRAWIRVLGAQSVFHICMGDGSVDRTVNSGAVTVDMSAWNHLALTWTPSGYTCFVNGFPCSYSGPVSMVYGSTVGLGCFSGSTLYQANGLFADFRVYDVALTPAEVSAIMGGADAQSGPRFQGWRFAGTLEGLEYGFTHDRSAFSVYDAYADGYCESLPLSLLPHFSHEGGSVTFSRMPEYPDYEMVFDQAVEETAAGETVAFDPVAQELLVRLTWSRMPEVDKVNLENFFENVVDGTAKQFTYSNNGTGPELPVCFADAELPIMPEVGYQQYQVSITLRVALNFPRLEVSGLPAASTGNRFEIGPVVLPFPIPAKGGSGYGLKKEQASGRDSSGGMVVYDGTPAPRTVHALEIMHNHDVFFALQAFFFSFTHGARKTFTWSGAPGGGVVRLAGGRIVTRQLACDRFQTRLNLLQEDR